MPLIRRDGNYFGVLCALDPDPAEVGDDEVEMLQLLANLISFELEADDQRQQTEVQLAEAQAAAVARERFIAELGHDLRTPLTAIRSTAQLMLRSGRLSGDEREDLELAMDASTRMARMIADLLDFAHGRMAGGLPLRREDVDAAAVCREVLREFERSYPGREVCFTISGQTDGWLDRGRLAQVVANLVANAIQYSPREQPVEVALHGGPEAIVLDVLNREPLIAPEVLEVIFDPFRREARSGDNPSGLGLGLYIVQEIVQAHGGTVEASSTTAEGTRFRARFPRA